MLQQMITFFVFCLFFNWDLLYARLNNHCKARSYRKKRERRRKGTRRKRCKCLMLILMFSCLFSNSLTIVRALSKVSFSRKHMFLIKVFMKKTVLRKGHQIIKIYQWMSNVNVKWTSSLKLTAPEKSEKSNLQKETRHISIHPPPQGRV